MEKRCAGGPFRVSTVRCFGRGSIAKKRRARGADNDDDDEMMMIFRLLPRSMATREMVFFYQSSLRSALFTERTRSEPIVETVTNTFGVI